MTREEKKSKKELREEAETQLKNVEKKLTTLKKQLENKKRMKDSVLSGFVPTEKYLESVDFIYQKSDEFIEANRVEKEIQYDDLIEEIEQKIQILVDYIPKLKNQIKENRG